MRALATAGAALVGTLLGQGAATATPTLPVLVIHPDGTPSAHDYGVIRPSRLSFTTDVRGLVTGITWSSWTATGAVGHGKQVRTDCVPTCATSTRHYAAATITLSKVSGGVFTRLVERVDGRTTTYSGTHLLLRGAGSAKHHPLPHRAGAPCTVAALTAAARAGTPDFYAFDTHSYGCSGAYAYAGVAIRQGGYTNEITEVFQQKNGGWVRATRALCDQGVIPAAIVVPACESN